MFKINWANSFENILFFVVGCVLTTFAHTMFNKTVQPTIEKAIDKETVKNEVNNEINTRKIKNAKDLSLVLKPNNNQKATINNSDLFCIDTTKLSKPENRRLKRWLK